MIAMILTLLTLPIKLIKPAKAPKPVKRARTVRVLDLPW